jgi:hypothetical protein
MPIPHFEVPTGAIDGVNTSFQVSVPYQPGSTAVFLNGLLQERSLEDGWYETDPLAGEIVLKEAPRPGVVGPDVLQVFFLDTSPALPEVVVQRIHGRLAAIGVLEGLLTRPRPIRGRLVLRCGL